MVAYATDASKDSLSRTAQLVMDGICLQISSEREESEEDPSTLATSSALGKTKASYPPSCCTIRALLTTSVVSEKVGFRVPQAYKKGVDSDPKVSAAETLIFETLFERQNSKTKGDFVCTSLELSKED